MRRGQSPSGAREVERGAHLQSVSVVGGHDKCCSLQVASPLTQRFRDFVGAGFKAHHLHLHRAHITYHRYI